MRLGLVDSCVKPYMFGMRNLVLFHAALADETRLRLLCLMREKEICVCHLQGILQTNQPKISRHLAYLRKAGLVAARRDGKWTHYRLGKQTAGLNRILEQVLTCFAKEPKARLDQKRLRKICCCPDGS